MRQVFSFFVISLICNSCTEHSSKATGPDSPKVAADSLTNEKYVDKGHLETINYSIRFSLRYSYPPDKPVKNDSDADFRGFYVMVFDKNKKKSDTVEVTAQYDSPCIIRDLTDSLKLPWALFQIVIPVDDGYYSNDFVKYENGAIKSVIWLEDYDSTGIHLQRTSEQTLSGFMTERDEVFYGYENNFPISIDLNTFHLNRNLPPTQYIGYHTVATQSFKAHMVINGQVDDKLYDVNKGDSVIIDTLYRNLQKVHLRTTNDVQLEIKVETAKKKIQQLMVG